MDEINLGFVKKIMPKFRIWLDTDKGEEFIAERVFKDSFFESNFSFNAINKSGVIKCGHLQKKPSKHLIQLLKELIMMSIKV